VRIPLRYLANLLTRVTRSPVALALDACCDGAYMRAKTIDGVID